MYGLFSVIHSRQLSLQEVSGNSSGWLAPERPRGFQGKLRLRKSRSGAAALKRAAPSAAAPPQPGGLHGSSHKEPAANEMAHYETYGPMKEQQDSPPDEDITSPAFPEAALSRVAQKSAEDAQHDMVDITPEQPQWRSKRSIRLQQLAESAPARRQAGAGRLPLVQQPLMHPARAPTRNSHLEPQPPQLQPAVQQEGATSAFSLQPVAGQQDSAHTACSNRQHDSHSSARLPGGKAPSAVPETCVPALDAVPDTPECRPSKQSSSMQSPPRQPPHHQSVPQQHSFTAPQQGGSLKQHDSGNLQGAQQFPRVASGAPEIFRRAGEVGKSSAHREARISCTIADPHSGVAAHCSTYSFGQEVVSAAPCSSGR